MSKTGTNAAMTKSPSVIGSNADWLFGGMGPRKKEVETGLSAVVDSLSTLGPAPGVAMWRVELGLVVLIVVEGVTSMSEWWPAGSNVSVCDATEVVTVLELPPIPIAPETVGVVFPFAAEDDNAFTSVLSRGGELVETDKYDDCTEVAGRDVPLREDCEG